MTQAYALPNSTDWLSRFGAMALRTARFWRIALWFAALGVVVSLLIPYWFRPVYRSETVLLYQEGIHANYLDSGADAASATASRHLGPRLKDMLLARGRLEKIVEEFHLYSGTVAQRGLVEAADELRTHIDFKAREGDTFHITFDATDPNTVYAVTTRLAEGLIEENNRLRIEQTAATKEFLEAENKRTEEQLKGSEKALATFLADHPEFAEETSSGQASVTVGASVRAAGKKERELMKPGGGGVAIGSVTQVLERQAARLRDRLQSAETSPSSATPAAAPAAPASDPVHEAAKSEAQAQLTAAQKDLAEKQSRFTEQHPDVVAARTRVRAAEEKFRQVVEHGTSPSSGAPAESTPGVAIDSEKRSALQAQLARIERELILRRGVQKRTADSPDTAASDSVNAIVGLETDWSRVNRDATEARERNQQIQDKLFKASIEASVESSGRSSQMVVVDPAFKPVRPIAFGRTRVIAAGLATSFVVALLVALGCALLDDRLYDAFDAQRLAISSFVLTIPKEGRGNSSKPQSSRNVSHQTK